MSYAIPLLTFAACCCFMIWQGMKAKRRYQRKVNFEIGPNGEWIRCGKCGMRSYNKNDVENRYCGNCHLFLK